MLRIIYDLNTSKQTYFNLHEFPMWTDWNGDYLQILEMWTLEKWIEDLSNQLLKKRQRLNQIHEKMASWGRNIGHLIIGYLRPELLQIRKRHRLLQNRLLQISRRVNQIFIERVSWDASIILSGGDDLLILVNPIKSIFVKTGLPISDAGNNLGKSELDKLVITNLFTKYSDLPYLPGSSIRVKFRGELISSILERLWKIPFNRELAKPYHYESNVLEDYFVESIN